MQIILILSNYIFIQKNCTYLKLISQDSSGPDYSTFVSLCRKGSYQGEIYDQCDLAKFILRYGENNEE